ncbi:MAG TPA: DUF6285 domain-containing protein [Solirubrobacteraceae bacterium]|jgi:hypothetical protein
MQDRPDAHELLDALAGWLAGELAPRLPREERFGVRVAANVATIVGRELGPDAPGEPAERERMERLLALAGQPAGGDDDARALQRRVADAIRAGRLDGHWAEALALLRESVRDKLAVARPGYDSFEEPAG